MKCETILDYPIDHYASKDFFESKFLRNAKTINVSCVGLRHGLDEILEACASSLHKKVGKMQGVHMIKDLISKSVIEYFREIFEKCKFDKGLSMMKVLEHVNNGIKIVLMNKDEGRLLLENTNNAAIEIDDGMTENTSSNLINDHHVDCVKTNKTETHADSDSSSCSDYEAAIEK